jgi:hypothetical protein
MSPIILVLIVGIALIYWFQKSMVNNKSNQDGNNKIRQLYNNIKLPVLVICMSLIIMSLCTTQVTSNVTEQKVFTSLPNF